MKLPFVSQKLTNVTRPIEHIIDIPYPEGAVVFIYYETARRDRPSTTPPPSFRRCTEGGTTSPFRVTTKFTTFVVFLCSTSHAIRPAEEVTWRYVTKRGSLRNVSQIAAANCDKSRVSMDSHRIGHGELSRQIAVAICCLAGSRD